MKRHLLFFALLSLILAPIGFATGNKASAGPLGDLSSYLVIAKDTLKIVDTGDLKAAKVRIKDLETAWDEAEEKMKPMSPDDWETTDQAIDKALAKLRSAKPKQDTATEALKKLISIMEEMKKPKK